MINNNINKFNILIKKSLYKLFFLQSILKISIKL